MGTVNYFTSDYVTLGAPHYDANDFLNDEDFIRCYEEFYANVPGATIEIYARDMINSYYEDDLQNVKSILKKYSFNYFEVTTIPGCYEGFTVDIKYTAETFEDEEERAAAYLESKKLKECLTNIAGCGIVACYPGWGTTFLDYSETLQEIEKAIEEIEGNIDSTETEAER